MNDVMDVLRAAVSFGLPDTAPKAMPLSTDVIALAVTHRVQGLLWAAVEAGAIVGDESLVEQAREALLAGLRTCLVAEETAFVALGALDAAGVDARVLKGVAVAHLDHRDPAERIFGDADILVRRGDYELALASLTAAGFHRARPPVRGWWEHRFAKAVVLNSSTGGELDLHLAIAGGYFGETIDHDELWASPSDSFDLAGCKAPALNREARLLHACCHAVLGKHSGLRTTRDIAQILLISGADWSTALRRAQHNGIELVVARAVQETWSQLNLDAGHPAARWSAGHVADPAGQRALDGYAAAFAEGWAPEGHGVLAALGPLERIRFLAGLAFPSRESLRIRQRSWLQHVRSGTAALRGRG